MSQNLMQATLEIDGMTCSNCEMRIESELGKIAGIKKIKAAYDSSTVECTYDEKIIGIDKIAAAIEKLDYQIKGRAIGRTAQNTGTKSSDPGDLSINKLLGIGIILFAFYQIINNTVGFNFLPQVNQNMGYGILFIVGIITSLHCMAMCGGINLSQCVAYKIDMSYNGKLSKLTPSLYYNVGRVISYTIIGGIAGALGSVITFSGAAKGMVAVIAGGFMIIMGLNMLNIFPWLRRFNPRMPKIFGNKIYDNKGKHGPFYIGLLNGLMPCGPLQAMQIYALGTGSFVAGAASMFMFSLGTVPLMFGLGALSTVLSTKFTRRMMQVSALLVMMLGAIMISRGLILSGVAFASPSVQGNAAQIEGGVQRITSELESGQYPVIIVQKGIPVKWTIKADEQDINGCNETLIIPKFNMEKKLVAGDNILEFTPDEEDNIPFSCWMGMIRSNIRVVSDISKLTPGDIAPLANPGGVGGSGCCVNK